jgi:hypothetical protein
MIILRCRFSNLRRMPVGCLAFRLMLGIPGRDGGFSVSNFYYLLGSLYCITSGYAEQTIPNVPL